MNGEDCFRCLVNGEIAEGCDGCKGGIEEETMEERVAKIESDIEQLALLSEKLAEAIKEFTELSVLLTMRVTRIESRLNGRV